MNAGYACTLSVADNHHTIGWNSFVQDKRCEGGWRGAGVFVGKAVNNKPHKPRSQRGRRVT